MRRIRYHTYINLYESPIVRPSTKNPVRLGIIAYQINVRVNQATLRTERRSLCPELALTEWVLMLRIRLTKTERCQINQDLASRIVSSISAKRCSIARSASR
jgi:hypothetical protein